MHRCIVTPLVAGHIVVNLFVLTDMFADLCMCVLPPRCEDDQRASEGSQVELAAFVPQRPNLRQTVLQQLQDCESSRVLWIVVHISGCDSGVRVLCVVCLYVYER